MRRIGKGKPLHAQAEYHNALVKENGKGEREQIDQHGERKGNDEDQVRNENENDERKRGERKKGREAGTATLALNEWQQKPSISPSLLARIRRLVTNYCGTVSKEDVDKVEYQLHEFTRSRGLQGPAQLVLSEVRERERERERGREREREREERDYSVRGWLILTFRFASFLPCFARPLFPLSKILFFLPLFLPSI